jgi:hypothetical protein
LAHQLQRITIAVVAGTVCAAAAPFSHKLHLKLKPDCRSCHTAAASSTKPTDNLLPNAESCRACHQQPPAIKEPAKTLLNRFDHARHVKLGNVAPVIAAAIDSKAYLSLPADAIRKQLDTKNACAACHHGIEESEAVSKANLPQMADCLVCHTKVDPPFSCEFCHDANALLKPASHVAGFADAHSSPKLAKAGCAVCHGRKFMCLGCH